MKRNFALGAVALAVIAVPAVFAASPKSGLKPGQSVSPFHPKHIAGPLANTTNCFPCTFQNRPQVQAWVNGDSEKNVAALATMLDKAMEQNKGSEFKAMIVFVTDPANMSKTEAMARGIIRSANLKNVDIALIDKNDEAVENYKINTAADVKNTVFAYKNWKVANTFVNWQANAAGNSQLAGAINTIVR